MGFSLQWENRSSKANLRSKRDAEILCESEKSKFVINWESANQTSKRSIFIVAPDPEEIEAVATFLLHFKSPRGLLEPKRLTAVVPTEKVCRSQQ